MYKIEFKNDDDKANLIHILLHLVRACSHDMYHYVNYFLISITDIEKANIYLDHDKNNSSIIIIENKAKIIIRNGTNNFKIIEFIHENKNLMPLVYTLSEHDTMNNKIFIFIESMLNNLLYNKNEIFFVKEN